MDLFPYFWPDIPKEPRITFLLGDSIRVWAQIENQLSTHINFFQRFHNIALLDAGSIPLDLVEPGWLFKQKLNKWKCSLFRALKRKKPVRKEVGRIYDEAKLLSDCRNALCHRSSSIIMVDEELVLVLDYGTSDLPKNKWITKSYYTESMLQLLIKRMEALLVDINQSIFMAGIQDHRDALDLK